MEKAIQAINVITPATASNGNTTGKPSADGEATAFSQLLSPAREQAALPAGHENGETAGNPLPGKQSLPEGTAAHTVTMDGELLSTLVEQTDAEAVAPAAVLTQKQPDTPLVDTELVPDPVEVIPTLTTPVTAEQAPAVTAALGKPAPEQNPVVMPGAIVRGEQPAAEDAVLTVTRETVAAVNRGEAVSVAPVTTLQSTSSNAATMTDAVQGAVRTSVQQAIAVQITQEGLQQSLSGNRQAAQLISTQADGRINVEQVSTSFTPILSELAMTPASSRVTVPVGEAGWGRAVGEQVVWHVSQNIQSANLRLNPQHLGPLEMQVQMDGDKATLAFASQHAVVRDALESALPRLRDMFAQNGLNIVDVNVSQEQAAKGEQQAAQTAGNGQPADETITHEELAGISSNEDGAGLGLVDYYV